MAIATEDSIFDLLEKLCDELDKRRLSCFP